MVVRPMSTWPTSEPSHAVFRQVSRGDTHTVGTLNLLVISFSSVFSFQLHLIKKNCMLNEPYTALKWHQSIFLVLYRHIYWCAASSSSTYPKAVWVSQMSVSLCSVTFCFFCCILLYSVW